MAKLPLAHAFSFHPCLPSTTPPPASTHFHLDGDSLTLSSSPLTSIATGSLQNKIFPPQKELLKSLKKAFTVWQRKNAIPSVPTRHLDDLWTPSWIHRTHQLRDQITTKTLPTSSNCFQGLSFITKTNVPLLSASTVHACTLNALRLRLPTLMFFAEWMRRRPR